MSDFSITAGNVVFSQEALQARKKAIAGEALTLLQVIYLDSTDSYQAKKADSNSGTAAARVPVGFVCSPAAAEGQPVEYIEFDPDITIGSHGGTVGAPLILSATPGGIAPAADLTTGWYGAIVGIVKSSTKFALDCRHQLRASAAAA